MPDKNGAYRVSENSLKKAQELFGTGEKKSAKKTNKKNDKKRLKKEEQEKNNLVKARQYCTCIPLRNRRKFTAQAFLPTFALVEMRSCLMKHDWINLQRLFPLLLELPKDKETFLWRYAFTIFVHSPMSSESHLQDFLYSCAGCQSENLNDLIQKLVGLRLDVQDR